LRRLYLAESLTDDGMANLAMLRGLKKLSMEFVHELPDASYARLGALAGLEEFALVNTDHGVGPEALAGLGRLRRLRRLELTGDRVTDAGLDHLAGLEKLGSLVLWNASVTGAGARRLKERLRLLSTVELRY